MLILVSLLCCSAQPNAIQIGTTELRLGMAKSDVLTKLAREFELSGDGADNSSEHWSIKSRDHSSNDWLIGSVEFLGQKLTSISKQLGDIDGQSAARTIGNLFRALQGLQKPGTNNWVPMAATTQEFNKVFEGNGGKESRVRFIHLETPDHHEWVISVDEIVGSDHIPHVQISESLRARPRKPDMRSKK